jgi:aryl-alcohol dehydrogenase-like predicted oxidoreductase
MKLVLGTAQMGLNYGINNNSGQICFEDCIKIFKQAHIKGIEILDTAEVYGNAHQIIGDFHKHHPKIKFKVITKIPSDVAFELIHSKVLSYIKELNVDKIEVLMFHSYDCYKENKNNLKDLLDLKNKGYINHVGVSVYTNEQIEELLFEDIISVVQLPFNLLDNYSLRGELINQLKNKEKTIHTRSAFLQGLFFKNVKDENSIVQQLQAELQLLQHIILKSNCTMEELALSYCLQQTDIDNVIIGVDSINHLESNINASTYAIKEEDVDKINSIKIENVNLLNPSLW